MNKDWNKWQINIKDLAQAKALARVQGWGKI